MEGFHNEVHDIMHRLERAELESRISKILYSGSPSRMTRGSGVGLQLENKFGVEGSNIEMWKTGWMEC